MPRPQAIGPEGTKRDSPPQYERRRCAGMKLEIEVAILEWLGKAASLGRIPSHNETIKHAASRFLKIFD